MYSAGLPILKCLETLEQQTQNRALKRIIADVRENVGLGYSLRAAFGRHKGVFSEFFLGMVEAGEVGHKLDATLEMSAAFLEKQANLRQKVKAAFAYPAIVTVMCCAVITFLLIFVIPVFSKLYTQVHAQMPGPTVALVMVSNVLRHWWWTIVIVAGAIALAIRRLSANAWTKAYWDEFKLNMPVFGVLNRMLAVSHFTRTFAMLTSVGVSVIKSLDMANLVANNRKVSEITAELKKSIQAGATISASLKKYDLFPPVMTKGADLLDRDIERTINALLTKLEPILTLSMGVIVGLILMGAYLPMFDYMGHLK